VHHVRDTLLIEPKSPFTGYALLSLAEKRRGNAKGGVYLLSRQQERIPRQVSRKNVACVGGISSLAIARKIYRKRVISWEHARVPRRMESKAAFSSKSRAGLIPRDKIKDRGEKERFAGTNIADIF